MVHSFEHPLVGRYRGLSGAYRLSKAPARAAPALSQHADEVLAAPGYDARDIDELRRPKVIASTSARRRKFWDIPIPHSRHGRIRTSRHSHCIQRLRSCRGFPVRENAYNCAHKNVENPVFRRHFLSLRALRIKLRK
jgi:hypothetical protein